MQSTKMVFDWLMDQNILPKKYDYRQGRMFLVKVFFLISLILIDFFKLKLFLDRGWVQRRICGQNGRLHQKDVCKIKFY